MLAHQPLLPPPAASAAASAAGGVGVGACVALGVQAVRPKCRATKQAALRLRPVGRPVPTIAAAAVAYHAQTVHLVPLPRRASLAAACEMGRRMDPADDAKRERETP